MLWKLLFLPFITKHTHHPTAAALLQLVVLEFLNLFTLLLQGLKVWVIWAPGALNDCPLPTGIWTCWNYLDVPHMFISLLLDGVKWSLFTHIFYCKFSWKKELSPGTSNLISPLFRSNDEMKHAQWAWSNLVKGQMTGKDGSTPCEQAGNLNL